MKYWLLLFISIPVFSADRYFDFPGQSVPGEKYYRGKSTFCFLNFSGTDDERYSHFSKGLPSVLNSGFSSFQFAAPLPPYRTVHPFRSKEYRYYVTDEKGRNRRMDAEPFYSELARRLMEDSDENSAREKCDYILTGSYQVSGENLQVRVEISDLLSGSSAEFSETVSERRGYQELDGILARLKKFMTVRDSAQVSVEAEEDSLVFLNGLYIGKSPVENVTVPRGNYLMKVTRRGFADYRKRVELRAGSNSLNIQMVKSLREGILSIQSVPEDASVYLGSEFVGKTPIEKKKVLSGPNRLRISSKGFVDYITGVNISDKETVVSASLREGDSVSYWQNKPYLYQDYTYYDFAVFSAYSVLLFYAGYAWADVRERSLIDEMRPEVRITSPLFAWQAAAAGGSMNNFLATLWYDEVKISEVKKEAARYRNIKNVSAAAGGVMLVSSFVFLFLGLDHESVDIGLGRDQDGNMVSRFSFTWRF